MAGGRNARLDPDGSMSSNQAPEEHTIVSEMVVGAVAGAIIGAVVVAEAVVVVGVVAGPGIMEVAGSVNRR